jgi:hypothetical protein
MNYNLSNRKQFIEIQLNFYLYKAYIRIHFFIGYWVLGIGYDMCIYPIPIPKIPNSYGYLPNTHTQILNICGYFGCGYWVYTQKIEYLGMSIG